jgi:hypothetical protein
MVELEDRAPGLFFAGHYRDGISLGDSILSGSEVAGRMDSYLTAGGGRAPVGVPKT